MKYSRVRQRDLTDCGAACLSSLAAYYGLFIPVTQIRQWAGTDRQGTSILGLMNAAGKMKLQAKAVRTTIAGMAKLSYPVMAHVKINEAYTHFVVVMRVEGKEIHIMDPADGEYRKMSIGEFEVIWTGIMLLISPREDFTVNCPTSNRGRFIRMLKPHYKNLLQALFAAVIFTVLALTISVYIKFIVDEVLESGNLEQLVFYSVMMLILLVVQLFTGIIKQMLTLKTSQAIDRQLIPGYYHHLLHLPQQFFDRMQTGEMVSRINDAGRINAFINETLVSLVVDGLIIVLSIILMFVYHWKLALLMLFIFPVYGLLIYLNDNLNKKWQRRILEKGAEVDSHLVQSLNAASTIKALVLEGHFYRKILRLFDELLQLTKLSVTRQIYIHCAADFFTRSFTVIILWLGCYQVFAGEITKGELLSFFAMTSYFTAPVMSLLVAGKNIRDTMIATERLSEITELQVETADDGKLKNCAAGDIEFRNVSFSYGNGERVLKNINITIPKNSITGIKGTTGSGKSTLLALLLRLYEPTGGAIFINGVNLKEIGLHSLRKLIAYVPQHTDVFSGSIRENVFPGDSMENGACSRETAEILAFFDEMENGIGTHISEQGLNLSGGQKQKIAFARALVRESPILVLDEPTAAMDRNSENKLMQTIESYKNKGKTVIIISHSDNALKICDNIVFLNHGQITRYHPPL